MHASSLPPKALSLLALRRFQMRKLSSLSSAGPVWRCSHPPRPARWQRCASGHARNIQKKPDLLSKIYVPTSKVNSRQHGESLKSLQYLLKGGFIRQSSAGIYSLLPLGQRVIDKLSHIIEEEMYSIGASKVTLPHLLPPDLWEKSGRWESSGPELYRLKDRREADMLLAPTHEEEITALVAADAPSERNLPVRLFQIGRKFRDEARPRAGLLRGREFLMKDLYTFDATEESAQSTYNDAKEAYVRIFDRIGLPYLVAEADTGNIGGTSSHEFHYPSKVGEDTLITCPSCKYVANSELAKSTTIPPPDMLNELDVSAHLLDLPTENALGIAILRKDKPFNTNKAKSVDPEARGLPALTRDLDSWDSLSILLDETCVTVDGEALMNIINRILDDTPPMTVWPMPPSYTVGDFRVAEGGEKCTTCGGKLESTTSIEVAHTFLLGTKYSQALDLTFARAHQAKQSKEYYQMGCYGIGVTRLMGSIGELQCDDKGLRWPESIAPYQFCFIILDKKHLEDALTIAAGLDADIVIDDRCEQTFGKRIRDAELIGYPFVAVLGRDWEQGRLIELHERATGEKASIGEAELRRKLEAGT